VRQPSDILKEIGFNEDAPESTKRAFVKHLERAIHTEISTSPRPEISSPNEQLSFEFSYQTEDVETDQLELPLKTNLQAS